MKKDENSNVEAVDGEEMPKSITVILAYPKETGMVGHEFTELHMLESEEIENVEAVLTED